jgi:hypothetical protein
MPSVGRLLALLPFGQALACQYVGRGAVEAGVFGHGAAHFWTSAPKRRAFLD